MLSSPRPNRFVLAVTGGGFTEP
uniref:Uncharacterized protein n=1 Tax=Arundo donax TaxID=35708 RepID=A0A0A8Y4T2_ARUDO